MSIQLPPGSMIDRFRLLEFCGEGAGGSVYRASDPELGRDVALKFLIQSPLPESDGYQRFLREGQVLSALTHTNLAKVYGVGIWNGKPYLVMEFIKGTSLRTILNQGKLSANRALRLMRQICCGMSVVHTQAIVHRDLKPENIMVQLDESGNEQAKIIDFGLSMLLESDQQITSTGTLIGTAQYMSPEQCLGMRASLQSDIYALGCIFYEMLTGNPPFQADNHVALLHKHVNETPAALSKTDPALAPFDSAVRKSLAKSPHDRFTTAQELLQELESCANTKITRKSIPAWIPVLSTMLFLAGAIFYILLGAPQSAGVLAKVSALSPPATACTFCMNCGNWYSSKLNWTDAAVMYTAARQIPSVNTRLLPLANARLSALQAEAFQKSGDKEKALLAAFDALDRFSEYVRLRDRTETDANSINAVIETTLNVLDACPVSLTRLRQFEIKESFWPIVRFLESHGLYNSAIRLCDYRFKIAEKTNNQPSLHTSQLYLARARLEVKRSDLDAYLRYHTIANNILLNSGSSTDPMVTSWRELANLADTLDHPEAANYAATALRKAQNVYKGTLEMSGAALTLALNEARLGKYEKTREFVELSRGLLIENHKLKPDHETLAAFDNFLCQPDTLDDKSKCARLLLSFAIIEMKANGNYIRCLKLLQRAAALTTDNEILSTISSTRNECNALQRARQACIQQPPNEKPFVQ